MEGIDGDTIIRIGIHPSISDGSIVDGENLDSLLVCLFCPINKFLQVAEVAHTEATFTTEREYRDSGTCHLARHRVELYFHFLCQEDFTLAQIIDIQMSVFTCFPFFHVSVFSVYGYKFIFQGEGQVSGREGSYPFVRLDFFHADEAARCPIT